MAFTVDQAGDIEILKGLSTHVTFILDTDSEVCSDRRLLTALNITNLNTLYTSVITRLTEIVDSQAGVP